MTELKGIPDKANIKSGGGLLAIVPQTLDEAFRFSQMVLQSGMFPDSLKKNKTPAEQAAAVTGIILKGMEVGLPPFSALANIMEINNRFSIWGDGAKALVLNSGQIELFEESFVGDWGSEDFKAVCKIKRIGMGEVVTEFSWADAKLAKLNTKVGPWMQYPKRQLQMRARSWAMRDSCPDILQGLSIAEEVRDIPQPKEETNTDFLDAGLPAIEAPKEEATPVVEEELTEGETPTDQETVIACAVCNGRLIVEDAEGKGPCGACQTSTTENKDE